MFQDLLNWILANCILSFTLSGKNYILSSNFSNNFFILIVNFGFWVVLVFVFNFSVKLVKWCMRKCLRK